MSDGEAGHVPAIEVFEHHRVDGVDGEVVELFGNRVVAACLAERGRHEAPLAGLERVEVNLVSDAVIADVHGRFMDDPTATDVITFQHGEVFVSLDTAVRCAGGFGVEVGREVVLYVTHALLHLNGWEDRDGEERAAMAALQERLVDRHWG